ncbi:MAG: hypothetical protein WCK67_01480 [bacterium]
MKKLIFILAIFIFFFSAFASANNYSLQKNPDLRLKVKTEQNQEKLTEYKKYINTLPKNKIESITNAKNKYFQLFSVSDSLNLKDKAFFLFQKKYMEIIDDQQSAIGFMDGLHIYKEIKKDYCDIDKKRLKQKEDYYKQYGLKLNYIYKGYVPDIDYNYLINQFKTYISPQMKEYLSFCFKNPNLDVIDEGEVLINWDKLRERLIYLENFINKNPDFAAKDFAKESLNWYLDLYTGETSSLYSNNFDTQDYIRDDAKHSFEIFIKQNKSSKYYLRIYKKYNQLKKYNFNISKYNQY